jgi:arsenate reductase
MRQGMTTVDHDPNCGRSRRVLAMIRNAGVEPTIVEYLKTPPSRDELADQLLINWPIVVTDKGVRLCRPAETALEMLENLQQGAATTEDGEAVAGHRTT